MKNILLSLPSRDRPDMLSGAIDQIFGQSNNHDNFDLYVIIDNDQKDIYQPVINKHPYVLWDFKPRGTSDGVRHLYMYAFEYFLSRRYYFLWQICDDTHNFPKDWDVTISAKKKYFNDDLFSLYTMSVDGSVNSHGRSDYVKSNCYSVPYLRPRCDKIPVQPTDWAMYHGLGELHPIFAKKFVEYLKLFYENNTTCPGGNDMVTAAIIQQLYIKYGHNRNVLVELRDMGCINHYTNHHLMSVDKHPFSVEGDIIPIVNSMNEYIAGGQI